MLSYNTLQTLIQLTRMFFDVGILWILLFYTIKIVRNNSRTAQIFKGIILILIVRAIANYFGFKAVDWLAGVLVTYGFLAIIIIFQPEIRTILERLGKNTFFSRLSTLSGNERERLVEELVSATMNLSSNRVGALITLEQGTSLSEFIKTGTPINSIVTAELLNTIFLPNTPIHDGAVIIQGDRIACASAYFPPTNLIVPTRFGARHRAAIGISEITDSVTIVVSEKSGRVSIAEDGKLIPVNQSELKVYLEKVILHGEEELASESSKTIIPVAPLEDKGPEVIEDIKEELEKTSLLKSLFGAKEKENSSSSETQETETEAKEVLEPVQEIIEEVKEEIKEEVQQEVIEEVKEEVKEEVIEEVQVPVEEKTEEVKPEPVKVPQEKKVGFFSKLFSPKVKPIEEVVEVIEEPVVVEKPKRVRKKKEVEVVEEAPKKRSPRKKKESLPSPESSIEPIKDTPHISLEFSVSDESLLDDLLDDKKGDE
jgi:diadenylate cyclase